MTAASRILEADRQARWRLRHEQGTDKPRKSKWIITTLQRYLPPEHVALCQRLAALQAVVEGCRDLAERVDGAGNGVEAQMARQVDALQALYGYEAAARTRFCAQAAKVVMCIAASDSLERTMRVVGYPRGSSVQFRELVQLTLIHLQEYEDDCRAPPMRPGEVRGISF